MTSNNLAATIAKLKTMKVNRDANAAKLRAQAKNAEANKEQIEKLADSEWTTALVTVEDSIEHVNADLAPAAIKLEIGKMDKPKQPKQLGEWKMHIAFGSQVETFKFAAVWIPGLDGKTTVWLTEEGFDHARANWEFTTQEISDDNVEEVINALLHYANHLD